MEHGFAMLATVLSRVHGGKAKVEDFIPQRVEEIATIDEVFGMLKKARKSKGGKHGKP